MDKKSRLDRYIIIFLLFIAVIAGGFAGVRQAGDYDIPGDVNLYGDEQMIVLTNRSGGSIAGRVSMRASSSLTGDVNFVLPTNDGNVNNVLTTDGSGNLAWADANGTGGGLETDPIFSASDVNDVNSINIAHWNTAYSWSDHAGLYDSYGEANNVMIVHLNAFDHNDIGTGGTGDANAVMADHLGTYDHNDIATAIQAETDPCFAGWDKSTGITITESQISDLGAYLLSETDPCFVAWNKSDGISITESQISDFGSYLESEVDPCFALLDVNSIDVSHWFTAYGWGNHASAGYLTSQTSHTDVVVDGDFTSQGIMLRGASSGTYSILTDNSSNWNTAYGWGDHSVAGYLDAETDPCFAGWDKSTGISITESQISDFGTYLTSETDPCFALLDINSTDVTRWATAYLHSQDNTQAHSDYLLNTGDTATGNYNFGGALYIDDTNDRVGIDITSPTSKLHLNGTSGDSVLRFGSTQYSTNFILSDIYDVPLFQSVSTNTVLRFAPYGATLSSLEFFGTDFMADSTNYERLMFQAKAGTPNRFFSDKGGTGTKRDISIYAESEGQLYLDTSGNVGIGTTDPKMKIDIQTALDTTIGGGGGDGGQVANFYNTGAGDSYFRCSVSGASSGDPGFLFGIVGVGGWLIGVDNSDGDKIKFSTTWNDLDGGKKLTIDTSGNVTMEGTLTVNGSQTGATDHVFDDYNDIELIELWREGKPLPFNVGDILNRDRLLRDAIYQQSLIINKLEERLAKLEGTK